MILRETIPPKIRTRILHVPIYVRVHIIDFHFFAPTAVWSYITVTVCWGGGMEAIVPWTFFFQQLYTVIIHNYFIKYSHTYYCYLFHILNSLTFTK